MSIPELLVCLALFSMLMLVAGMTMTRCAWILRRTTGRDFALAEIGKARRHLNADLVMTSLKGFQSTPQPSGDAVNFLTPRPHDDAEAAYANDGTVFFTRNVTYYLVTPPGHPQLNGPDGYEDACPHKTLQRATSGPTTPGTAETLLDPFTLPRPDAHAVGTNLLTFRCQKVSDGELELVLRATSLQEAGRELKIGSVPLSGTRYTVEQRWRVTPMN